MDTELGLDRTDPLAAVSPLDGRYAGRTAPLSTYVSEAALIRARVRVEVRYLQALADEPNVDVRLTADERETLDAILSGFDAEDARLVKRLETEGAAGYAATNHDVKAVEYFLRTRTPERLHPWIHFALTSEDVNNLARRLLVGPAVGRCWCRRSRTCERNSPRPLTTTPTCRCWLGHTASRRPRPPTAGRWPSTPPGWDAGWGVSNGPSTGSRGNSPAPPAATPHTTPPTPEWTGRRSRPTSSPSWGWNTPDRRHR
jgi:Adenylosuccinate lyase (EC 4.3.2.2)